MKHHKHWAFLAVTGSALTLGSLVGTPISAAATRPSVAKQLAHVPAIGWKGTITMFAQAYTPKVPGVSAKVIQPKVTALACPRVARYDVHNGTLEMKW